MNPDLRRFVPLAIRLPTGVWVLHARGWHLILTYAPCLSDSGELGWRRSPAPSEVAP
jgi:hypothetical protein